MPAHRRTLPPRTPAISSTPKFFPSSKPCRSASSIAPRWRKTREESAANFKLFGEPPLTAKRLVAHRTDGTELELYLYDPSPCAIVRAALDHIHGGGMILGHAKDMGLGPSGMAGALGIPVLSVEYRLAPETPFPGPQQDCLDGLA